MAIVNLETGEIFGCEPGSKTWYHEQGHIVFNKTNWGIKINYYNSFFQMIAIFTLSLSVLINWLPLKLFGLMNALGMVCCYLFEEVWCWIYALKHYNK
jgi:antibiotic biosynthesis monooxygenase (ABM) superfamily enzyme